MVRRILIGWACCAALVGCGGGEKASAPESRGAAILLRPSRQLLREARLQAKAQGHECCPVMFVPVPNVTRHDWAAYCLRCGRSVVVSEDGRIGGEAPIIACIQNVPAGE